MDRSSILLIDDNPQIHSIISDLLRPLDYQIFSALNGQEGLDLAHQHRPDLVLLDVMMPGMDGFAVCQNLRADPQLSKVPVIMITALDDRGSRLRGFESGADDFIGKPFDTIELRARVATIIRLNRYRLLLEEQERTAAEKARFAWVVEQSDDGYLIINHADEILYSNQRARELLSIGANERSPFLRCLARQYTFVPQQVWDSWPSPLADDAPRMLVRPETPMSSEFWLQVDLATQPPISDDRLVVRLRDVTTQITSQRDMWTFHAMMAHKLRTPLVSILGGLTLINDGAATMSREGIAHVSEIAIAGTRRLKGEIEDILHYLQSSTDLQGYARIGVSQIESMVAMIAQDLGINAIEMSCQESEAGRQVILGESSMEVVLRELLENACKFHPHQNPHVCVEIVKSGENLISIRVSDNGVTLSPEQISAAWRPYYQGERSFTGQIDGMGLGLALVERIIYAAGGYCALTNRSDAPGIMVEITLPSV